jgi:hypothetical protein
MIAGKFLAQYPFLSLVPTQVKVINGEVPAGFWLLVACLCPGNQFRGQCPGVGNALSQTLLGPQAESNLSRFSREARSGVK